ncbi:hypothetical protein TARUN_3012 [Trichoderma arundinaceum]|uniref:Uncharacterized protein n=1 Tax=Trichoderma arundinaceum TaxID=490622 RepID=A0A395NTD3_TRIAR|nr:hypothetical protein TARUN_3012 [Trichoderma arundinaceum]
MEKHNNLQLANVSEGGVEVEFGDDEAKSFDHDNHWHVGQPNLIQRAEVTGSAASSPFKPPISESLSSGTYSPLAISPQTSPAREITRSSNNAILQELYENLDEQDSETTADETSLSDEINVTGTYSPAQATDGSGSDPSQENTTTSGILVSEDSCKHAYPPNRGSSERDDEDAHQKGGGQEQEPPGQNSLASNEDLQMPCPVPDCPGTDKHISDLLRSGIEGSNARLSCINIYKYSINNPTCTTS